MNLFDTFEIKRMALILRAVNHKLRKQILDTFKENGRMTVTELYVRLRLEQSVASQHLAILRKAGMVKTEREGKFIYYDVNKPVITFLNTSVKKYLEEHTIMMK
jgi:DNA-binding transcriptional ArsR family regulator